jgi:hypothetical protein
VAACLGHGVPTSVVRRLMAMPRFSVRISELVDARMGDLPHELTAHQLLVLSLDRLALTGLLLRIGAIWFGRRIGSKIDGASVRSLVASIGPELRNLALTRRELAPESDGLELDEGADEIEALGIGIEKQGVACMKAWCARQPKPVGMRMELRLSRKPAPNDLHMENGPAIVTALLGALSS